MLRRLLVVAFAALALGTLRADAQSEIGVLVTYDCEQPTCTLRCTGDNTNIAENYKRATVFQWKDHVRRLWISVNNVQYVLGDDATCKFEGKPTFKWATSPLPQPTPACNCIGNQCFPPGCKK
jgi:hypothetical protein